MQTAVELVRQFCYRHRYGYHAAYRRKRPHRIRVEDVYEKRGSPAWDAASRIHCLHTELDTASIQSRRIVGHAPTRIEQHVLPARRPRTEPIPLSDFACAVLQAWKKESDSSKPYLFPSPKNSDRPISTVKTAWKGVLKRAGVPALSDLHTAACILYPFEPSGVGRGCATSHAPHKPGNQAPLPARYGGARASSC